ncbi:hypothetical protein [Streptomyces sp. CA-256286]|uniref:hypothetical protein n=1 Tax=Streptomyces sp. CA-256286 TaxID=2801033 RepID=UPI001BB6334C|nr:hypothetical protein [Streptomyces sp. CA-256286]QTA36712.1 hypothetical protein JHY03_69280 [Streptomyces sp. CA-256286]
MYTAESYQQALSAQQSERVALPAAGGVQQRFEARVFEAVVDSARDFNEHAFGIRRIHPERETVTLPMESAERAVNLLRYALPSYSEQDGRNGLAGAWIRRRTRHGIEIAGAGGEASVWLTGLSSADWTRAEATVAEEQADQGQRSLWQDTPRGCADTEPPLGSTEAEQRHCWDAYLDSGAWCASALLRRVAVFHTVTTADLVTCIRAAPGVIGYEDMGPVRWAFELDRRPGLPDSQHALIKSLTDPDFGLPLRPVPFNIAFFDNSARFARIGDQGATALIELRSSEIAYASLEGRPPWGDPVRFAEMGRAICLRVERNLVAPPHQVS